VCRKKEEEEEEEEKVVVVVVIVVVEEEEEEEERLWGKAEEDLRLFTETEIPTTVLYCTVTCTSTEGEVLVPACSGGEKDGLTLLGKWWVSGWGKLVDC
jgi:hypothetical protein